MSAEVLIYLQSLRKHIETNEEAKTYLLGNESVERFFEKVTKLAEYNFKKMGDPKLTIEQFELLRITRTKKLKKIDNLFFEFENYGYFCLN
jgi:hypothetical protein